MKMTVKELKDLLNKYNDNDIVEIIGGEDGLGEFCAIYINDEEILKED